MKKVKRRRESPEKKLQKWAELYLRKIHRNESAGRLATATAIFAAMIGSEYWRELAGRKESKTEEQFWSRIAGMAWTAADALLNQPARSKRASG